jgi:hypothetical protein
MHLEQVGTAINGQDSHASIRVMRWSLTSKSEALAQAKLALSDAQIVQLECMNGRDIFDCQLVG